MKKPEEFAEERTPLYDGPCPVGHHELTEWIKERDAEHATSSSVAWEALERIAEHMDGDDRWETFDPDDIDFVLGIARAALALRPGKP